MEEVVRPMTPPLRLRRYGKWAGKNLKRCVAEVQSRDRHTRIKSNKEKPLMSQSEPLRLSAIRALVRSDRWPNRTIAEQAAFDFLLTLCDELVGALREGVQRHNAMQREVCARVEGEPNAYIHVIRRALAVYDAANADAGKGM